MPCRYLHTHPLAMPAARYPGIMKLHRALQKPVQPFRHWSRTPKVKKTSNFKQKRIYIYIHLYSPDNCGWVRPWTQKCQCSQENMFIRHICRINRVYKRSLKTTFCDHLVLMQLFKGGPVTAFICGVLILQVRRYQLLHIVATGYVLMSKHLSKARHTNLQRQASEMITLSSPKCLTQKTRPIPHRSNQNRVFIHKDKVIKCIKQK